MTDPAPHNLYDTLKDFQPSLAAVVALLAAAVAYFGATARIRFDRLLAERDFTRKRIALLLRARFETKMVVLMAATIHASAEEIEKAKKNNIDPATIARMRPVQPLMKTPGIDEAWQNLHFFPVHTAEFIFNLMASIERARAALEKAFTRQSAEEIKKVFGRVVESGTELIKDLDDLTADLRSKLQD